MALHVRRLSLRTGRDYGELARCYWQGPIRRALPALGRYVRTQQSTNLNPNADEMRIEMMESDLRKDIAELIRRLGGR